MSKRATKLFLIALAVGACAMVPLWLSDAPRWLVGLALVGMAVAFAIELLAHGFAFRDKER